MTNTTNDNNTEKLRKASDLLCEVLDTLDPGTHKCECCGHNRHKKWNEHTAQEALKGAITRIEKAIKELEK